MLELTSAKQPSAEEQSSLNSLQAVFDKIDFDGSGSIEEDELAVALQDMGLASEPGTLNELFRRFAKTTPGSITFDEFVMIHQHSVSVGAERNSMFANLIGLELNSLGLEMPSSLVDLGAASRRLSANTAALFRSGTEPNPVANHAEESGEVYEAYIPTPPPATSRPTVHSMDDWNKASAEATLGGSPRISKVEARKFAHLGSSLDGPAPAPKRAVSFKEPTEEEGEDEEDGDQEEGGRGVKENETESPPNSADLGSEEVRALAPKGHPGSPGSFKMRRRPTSSSLTSEQTTRARLVFSRIDHDQSGGLDIGEVKLALQEMGAASDNATVTKMFEYVNSY
jgi:Ca2+-binding EF-hand superfamily protein